MQLHDPDAFELRQALKAFESGDCMLSEVCEDLGIRPGPVYDEYVKRLKLAREVPDGRRIQLQIEHHVGFDRIYNDLPMLVKTIAECYHEFYLYDLADYEPLPDTEWVIFLVPSLGFVKLYTSLFYDLGCYVEVVFVDPGTVDDARELAERIRTTLDNFYRTRVEREESLSHG